MANKLIFLSVKISNPFTGERFTKDLRIAEAFRNYIIEASKAAEDPIDVFLSNSEVEQLTAQEYRFTIQENLSNASCFLFICSDVRFINESVHIQNEINSYYTALENKSKPKNSIFRLTSKQFDQNIEKVDSKLRLTIQPLNSPNPFDETKNLEEIIKDLEPTFSSLYRLIKSVKPINQNEKDWVTEISYSKEYSNFKASFFGVQELVSQHALKEISTYFQVVNKNLDLDTVTKLFKNCEETVERFTTLTNKFEDQVQLKSNESIEKFIEGIFKTAESITISYQQIQNWLPIYEKAMNSLVNSDILLTKGLSTRAILRKLIVKAKKEGKLPKNFVKNSNWYEDIYNQFWGKKTSQKQIVQKDGVTFELLSSTSSIIKEVSLTIRKS